MTECLHPTPIDNLFVLTGTLQTELCNKQAMLSLVFQTQGSEPIINKGSCSPITEDTNSSNQETHLCLFTVIFYILIIINNYFICRFCACFVSVNTKLKNLNCFSLLKEFDVSYCNKKYCIAELLSTQKISLLVYLAVLINSHAQQTQPLHPFVEQDL